MNRKHFLGTILAALASVAVAFRLREEDRLYVIQTHAEVQTPGGSDRLWGSTCFIGNRAKMIEITNQELRRHPGAEVSVMSHRVKAPYGTLFESSGERHEISLSLPA